jgi:5-methylcytosine-specific restriction endonuclease McrA
VKRSGWAVCTRCGGSFATSPTGGRPRKRCDACRTNHAKIDGAEWRALRAQVLEEEPVCAVRGCGRPSTEADHIVPLVLGGPALDRTNLQGLCKPHNAAKGARVAPVPRRPYASTTRPCFHCGSTHCPGRWHL